MKANATTGAGWKAGLALVLLGLAGWMLRGAFSGPRIDLGPYRALGLGVAEETRKLVGGGGAVVVVAPDPGQDGDPVLESQLAAFRGAMSGAGGLSVKAVETVLLDPMTRMQTGGAVPADRYLALRAKHPEAVAWVLFMPFPALTDEALERLGSSKARVIVVSPVLPGYDALLKAGAFHLAVVPRPDGDAPGGGATVAAGETDRARFDREYLLMR